MSIGQNIKNARKSKGLSQKQLGKLLGVSQAAIGQFENEKSTPKIETIKKIATALDVPVSELVSSEFITPLVPLRLVLLPYGNVKKNHPRGPQQHCSQNILSYLLKTLHCLRASIALIIKVKRKS